MSAANTLPPIGQPLDRVDGRLKVTGGAKYAAEFNLPGLVHAYVVESTISKGRITAVDTAAAERAPGVLAVLTHLNAPKLKEAVSDMMSGGIRIEERNPLSDDVISYGGQQVALAVAETFEQARHAARLIRVTYAVERPALTNADAAGTAKKPKENNGDPIQVTKGDVAAGLASADAVVSAQTYVTPTEHHNPIEPAATVAHWPAPDRLVLHDATQGVNTTQATLADTFGLPRPNVQVISPFLGGGFGCKGASSMHTMLAAMAARIVGRPVKLPLTRAAMFTACSNRTTTTQHVSLAAAREDGKLRAVQQDTECQTSPLGSFVESCGATSANVLYASPAIGFTHTVFTVNKGQSGFMRAPGEAPGTYALESAMDELAYALRMDPIQLRLANYAERHPVQDKPWSTKFLRDAYRVGAEKFGWARRNPEPRSMREGNLLVGMGMATATYPGYKFAANARVRLHADGTVVGQCATHDIGTGAYTAFTQITAEAVGVPAEKVKFELGNTDLPHGPIAGGSNSTATVGHAIYNAAQALHAKLGAMAVLDPKSPLRGLNPQTVEFVGPGRLGVRGDTAKSDGFTDILARAGQDSLEADGAFKPATKNEHDAPELTFQSFGAQFVEVRVDPDLPRVQVVRVVSVMDCGRIINPKTARSQILGGVVMGLGMALTEETVYDRATGLPVTRNLADYHVPVNADVASIEPYFVGEPDLKFNPMGARGIGEIGITGVAAAVANAVFHATGVRVRDLPITPDKLLV